MTAKASSAAANPVVGRWYIPRPRLPPHAAGAPLERAGFAPRWVLWVSAERVLYSRGGDKHYECKRETFRRWVRATQARSGKYSKGFQWTAQ